MILSHDNRIGSDDPKLIAFHNTRGNPKEVICVRDDPFMHGFGPTIKSGEKVMIDGTVSYGNDFLVCIPDKCANYDYTAFEIIGG